MRSDLLRDYHYFKVATCPDQCDRKGDGNAGRFPKRASKEFARNLIGALVIYAPVAAFLTLWPVAPLGGVLIFGGIFLPAVAALITVAGVWAGRDTEAHDSGYDRPWGDGGYHYRDCPESGEGGWFESGGHGGGDGGGGF